jgi:hypothetical protein
MEPPEEAENPTEEETAKAGKTESETKSKPRKQKKAPKKSEKAKDAPSESDKKKVESPVSAEKPEAKAAEKPEVKTAEKPEAKAEVKDESEKDKEAEPGAGEVAPKDAEDAPKPEGEKKGVEPSKAGPPFDRRRGRGEEKSGDWAPKTRLGLMVKRGEITKMADALRTGMRYWMLIWFSA